MTDPQKDEHIEELLSKLQGIFGKLSHSEEEEAKQTIEIPTAPKEADKKETPSAPKPATPMPINLYIDPMLKDAPPPSEPSQDPAQPAVHSTPIRPEDAARNGSYESMVPTADPERVIVPTAVYFPLGKETEGKSLALKLETMAPKFTKVA